MKARRNVRILLIALLAALIGYRFFEHRLPLAKRLISVNDNTRNLAIAEISKASEKTRNETVAALLSAGENPNPRSRRFTLFALRKIGGPRPEIISYAIKALSDDDPHVRAEAAVTLMDFGGIALPDMLAAVKTAPDPALNQLEIIIGKQGGKAAPGLAKLLAGSPNEQLAAASILRRIGAEGKSAAPQLNALLDSADPMLRLASAEALHAMGLLKKNAAQKLSDDLLTAKESYKDLEAPRPRLARLLEKIDPRRRQLIDLGYDLLQKNAAVRYRAAFVLSESNPPNVGAIEMLVDALEDQDVYVAARAMAALTRIGLEKTERMKKVALPRMRSAIRRAQSANIDGFMDVVGPAMKAYDPPK